MVEIQVGPHRLIQVEMHMLNITKHNEHCNAHDYFCFVERHMMNITKHNQRKITHHPFCLWHASKFANQMSWVRHQILQCLNQGLLLATSPGLSGSLLETQADQGNLPLPRIDEQHEKSKVGPFC